MVSDMTEIETALREHAGRSDDELFHIATSRNYLQNGPDQLAAKKLLRDRQATRDEEKRRLDESRHTEVVELTKVGNKHSSDAVFWAIVAAILSAIGIIFGVLAWWSSSH